MIVPRMLHELELCQMDYDYVNGDINEQKIAQKSKPVTAVNTTRPQSQNSDEQHEIDAIDY